MLALLIVIKLKCRLYGNLQRDVISNFKSESDQIAQTRTFHTLLYEQDSQLHTWTEELSIFSREGDR